MSSVSRETGLDLLALALPFVACVIQWWLWPVFQPLVWFLFYPAIFLSAWLGRPPVSIAATLLASGLVIVVFMPPQFAFGGKNTNALFSAVVFVGMGLMFTWTHTRLRDAVRQTVGALREVELTNERLRIANADVTRLYEKTREMDRLKTQFFAHVSHELRTPLTLILGPVAKRLAADELNDESRHDLEVISRNARLLLRHVNDLLDVARLEAGRLELHYARVDVSKLVRFIASHFDVLAEEQRICYSVVEPGELPAEVDVARYERVLLNLLSNAFKFTPNGGSITATLTGTTEQVILTIDDSGTGVPEQQRTVIFESFRQLDGGDTRRHEGTGLGLAIVRQFTLQHGGTVRVEASPEGGARFVVTVPRLAPAGVSVDVAGDHAVDVGAAQQAAAELRVPDEVDAFPALTPATTSAALLVLVVEDHPDMRQYVVGILKGAYRVATARNGAEGLQAAVTLRPDVIVSDVMMPDMSGDQMALALRRRPEFDELPILLLTAKVDERLRAEMLRAGVQDYIAKPFEPDHLLARIEMLLSDAKRRRESLWATLSRLNSHVDNSPLAVVEFTPDFRITRWAGGAERMFGWRSDEVVGKRMNELRWVHEDDLDEVSA
ncbi:MAG: ATP-binding protein, partial [Acidobacteriota bacterium]